MKKIIQAGFIKGVINTFASGDLVSSSKINENFQSLKSAIEATNEVPIGSITAWHKNLGAVALPTGWVECNGQVLADAASPYDGASIPNLNGEGRFLRGSNTSGSWQNDQFQGHAHIYSAPQTYSEANNGTGPVARIKLSFNTSGIVTDGVNGLPRFGTETRPTNMSVVWIIKVK